MCKMLLPDIQLYPIVDACITTSRSDGGGQCYSVMNVEKNEYLVFVGVIVRKVFRRLFMGTNMAYVRGVQEARIC